VDTTSTYTLKGNSKGVESLVSNTEALSDSIFQLEKAFRKAMEQKNYEKAKKLSKMMRELTILSMINP